MKKEEVEEKQCEFDVFLKKPIQKKINSLDDLNTNQPKKAAPSASQYGKTPTPAAANNSRGTINQFSFL